MVSTGEWALVSGPNGLCQAVCCGSLADMHMQQCNVGASLTSATVVFVPLCNGLVISGLQSVKLYLLKGHVLVKLVVCCTNSQRSMDVVGAG